jgi:hypothetical protein
VSAFFLLMMLVWNAHDKASLAIDQLIEFKLEDSLLLLQLQKIEQQSILLHESLRSRVSESESASLDGNGLDVGVDVLKDQTDDLYKMESELTQDVSNLQAKMQASSVERVAKGCQIDRRLVVNCKSFSLMVVFILKRRSVKLSTIKEQREVK